MDVSIAQEMDVSIAHYIVCVYIVAVRGEFLYET